MLVDKAAVLKMESIRVASLIGLFLSFGSAAVDAYTTVKTPRTGGEFSPRIELTNPSSTNLTVGATAQFTCQTARNPPGAIQYQFWKGDVIVASTYDPFFTMKDVQTWDSGEYWCSMTAGTGKLKSVNTVVVNVRRPNQQHHPDNVNNRTITTMAGTHISADAAAPSIVLHKPMAYFYEGAEAHLSCEAPDDIGYAISYEFTKDGVFMASQREKDYFLYNLQQSDTGVYACALLMVYRKEESHNSVYIEVREYRDGDYDYYHSGASSTTATTTSTLVSCSTLITSLVLAVKGTLMGLLTSAK